MTNDARDGTPHPGVPGDGGAGTVAGPRGADALAAALRAAPPDDDALVRGERRLVAAVRARAEARRAGPRWQALGAGVALAAAAAAWLALGRPTPGEAPRGVDAPRALATGEVLRGDTTARATLGHADLEASADARATVRSDAEAASVVHLSRGTLRVTFHPVRRGEEHLAIVTDVARVEVVGTMFSVRVAPDGATRVEVTEGVVEVVALATGARQRLARGAALDVPAGGGARAATAGSPEAGEARAGSAVAGGDDGAGGDEGARGDEGAGDGDATTAVGGARVVDGVAVRGGAPAGEARAVGGRDEAAGGDGARAGEVPGDDAEGDEAASDAARGAALEAALDALDRGDEGPCARLAEAGPRDVRLDALEALADHRERHGALDAAEDAYARLLALDPSGARGATARFARASLRERAGARAGAADDFAAYLEAHPRGALAGQARAHLCALDAARCPAAP